MGSSLFKFSNTFLSSVNIFYPFNSTETLDENNSDDHDFANYLENYSQSVRQNQKNTFKKLKFQKSLTLNDKPKNEYENNLEKISYNNFTNSRISFRPKCLKIYINKEIEKDFLSQQLMNKKINRKMRKLNKNVNCISTTDTIY